MRSSTRPITRSKAALAVFFHASLHSAHHAIKGRFRCGSPCVPRRRVFVAFVLSFLLLRSGELCDCPRHSISLTGCEGTPEVRGELGSTASPHEACEFGQWPLCRARVCRGGSAAECSRCEVGSLLHKRWRQGHVGKHGHHSYGDGVALRLSHCVSTWLVIELRVFLPCHVGPRCKRSGRGPMASLPSSDCKHVPPI